MVRFLILCLLVAAGGRGWILVRWSPDVRGPEPELIRALVSDPDAQARDLLASPLAEELGLQRVERWVWDASAAVLILPGADGQPGQAGFDDDADGVVDNQTELGALHSDDVCLAPGDAGYWDALNDAASSSDAQVLSRGAFVPRGKANGAADAPQRLQLFGVLDGQPWRQWVIPGTGALKRPL